jgi:hypothetical protein
MSIDFKALTGNVINIIAVFPALRILHSQMVTYLITSALRVGGGGFASSVNTLGLTICHIRGRIVRAEHGAPGEPDDRVGISQ